MYNVGLLIAELCSAAAQRQRQQVNSYDYYQHGAAYHYDQHPDYSYSETEDYEVQPRKCYTCEYTILASQNDHEGIRQCNDPFTGIGVPEIQCEGPCAVSNKLLIIVTMLSNNCNNIVSLYVCTLQGSVLHFVPENASHV